MAMMAWIVFVLHSLVLILSLIVFIIFFIYINSFAAGEAKMIFILLTIFLGVYFLAHLSADGLELAQFLSKREFGEELIGTTEVMEHIFQAIGLGILFYISILFRSFAKKLEKIRKGA